jgi:phospholipase C
MQWYDERDIPFYDELASTFAVGDRYFASVMGPTFPNRDYLYAATSLGEKGNGFPNITQWGSGRLSARR